MEIAIINSESKSDFDLLLNLAKKIGVKTKKLKKDEIEDLGLHYAIKSARTGEYVDTDKFIKSLRK